MTVVCLKEDTSQGQNVTDWVDLAATLTPGTRTVVEHAFRNLTISSRSTSLLIEPLKRLGNVIVNHIANIGLVNPHSKCDYGRQHGDGQRTKPTNVNVPLLS